VRGKIHGSSWRFNGHRGRYLVFKGLLFIVIGMSYLLPAPTSGTERSLDFLLRLGLPIAIAGIPWILAGGAAIVGAFRSPPGRDGWAFQLLALLAVGWASIYFFSWVFGPSTRGWFLAVVFLAIAGSTYTVASMISVDQVRVVERAQGEVGDR